MAMEKIHRYGYNLREETILREVPKDQLSRSKENLQRLYGYGDERTDNF